MKILKFAVPAFFILLTGLFTGCIEISTLISVNRDGSGTVEETVLISKEIVEMIAELERSFTEDTTDLEPFQFYNEEELKTQSSNYGEEVRYVSSKKIDRDNREGYLVMYEFRDLNELKINQNPNSRVKLEAFEEEPEVTEEFITFSFIKGDPSEIRIQMPPEKQVEVDSSSVEEEMPEADTTMMNEQIAKVFQDLKMQMAINVEGDILKTNAEYVEGSRITLLEVNFGELIQNAHKMKEFRETDPQNFEQVKEILRGIPGIKVEINDLIYIQF